MATSRRPRLFSSLRPGTHWLAFAGLALTLTLSSPGFALSQEGAVTGTVRDAQTGQPLAAARVEILTAGGRTLRSGTSGQDGQFRLTGVPPGTYSLLFLAVGYEPRRVDRVVAEPAGVAVGRIDLVSRIFYLNPVVVTASRAEEKAVDAPASISTVETKDIEERLATTSIDHVRGLPGVNVITSGVARHSVAARGVGGTLSSRLFVLTDYRGPRCRP